MLLTLFDDFMNYSYSSMLFREISSLRDGHPQDGTNILKNCILTRFIRKIL